MMACNWLWLQFRGSDTLLWPSWIPGTRVICRQTRRQKIHVQKQIDPKDFLTQFKICIYIARTWHDILKDAFGVNICEPGHTFLFVAHSKFYYLIPKNRWGHKHLSSLTFHTHYKWHRYFNTPLHKWPCWGLECLTGRMATMLIGLSPENTFQGRFYSTVPTEDLLEANLESRQNPTWVTSIPLERQCLQGYPTVSPSYCVAVQEQPPGLWAQYNPMVHYQVNWAQKTSPLLNGFCGLPSWHGPSRLIYLNVWCPVGGTIWQGGVALLEKVCLFSLSLLPSLLPSLPSGCISRCELSATVSAQCLPACLVHVLHHDSCRHSLKLCQ